MPLRHEASFYTLSSCNTPKRKRPKRPKHRINTGVLSDRGGSECYPDLRMVREGSHDQRMMESDGSEGTERKAGPEAVIGEGLSVHYSGGSSLPSDVAAWLKKNGIGA